MKEVVALRPDVSKIEPHTPAWREWRRQGIGGSDAPIITGDSSFSSPYSLWLRKSGYLEDIEDEDDEPRYWGKRLESAVIGRFERDTELAVIERQLCVEHHLDRWRRATVDGFVFDSVYVPAGDALGLFEGKTTSKIAEWSDGIPAHVQIQVQHNLDVCELDHCWLAVLFTAPVVHFELFEIDRDVAITEPLRRMEQLFWQRVLDNNPPSPIAADLPAVKSAFARSQPDAIALDKYNEQHKLEEPIEAVIAELQAARAAKSSAEHRVETVEALLASLLQEHEVGTLGGVPVIHWKQHQREYFDIDALRKERPAIAQRFTTKRSYRQFTVPKRNRDLKWEG